MSGTHSFGRRLRSSIPAVVAVAALAFATSGAAASPRASGAPAAHVDDVSYQPMIVQATSVRVGAAAVERVGGRVSTSLPIVNGVAADVPTSALAQLARIPGVNAVTPDEKMHAQGTVDATPPDETYSGPPSVYGPVVRANRLTRAGHAGQGVAVALIDTGINPSPDLAGRVLTVPGHLSLPAECVNLTGESSCADGYGHGTFLAGIIAGDGTMSNGKYAGVAPEANLISIKVGSRDGSADVSNVLAGIQWAVSFKDDYNIRVLNLAYGTDSTQSWKVDPLNKAVEKAWKAGIVVVVAASNRGPDAGTISKPGDDPHVITVGATDDAMTIGLDDDLLPDFSSRGPAPGGVAKPDIVAPGAHLVSLRAIGSEIDNRFPNYVDDTYRQGSGTSMSTAVVSGAVADILSARPGYTPNRLKFALTSTARPNAVSDPHAIGYGLINANAAAFHAPRGRANQGLAWSTGLGDLDLSRGSVSVELNNPAHKVLELLWTAQGLWWDVSTLLGPWSKTTWTVSLYNLWPWWSTSWFGNLWEGDHWTGCRQGHTHDDCFYGHNWEGSAWYGAWD